MKSLNEIMYYLECPRKYSFYGTSNVEQELSDNDKLKKKVKEGVLKILKENISYDAFIREYSTHEITEVTNVSKLYEIVDTNRAAFTDNTIIKIALRKVDVDTSLYYNMSQVLENDNKELTFNTIILNKTPKFEQFKMQPRTKEQVEEINNQFKSIERIIDIVEKDNLPFIKRPNAITCKGCIFNKECKPICFERE